MVTWLISPDWLGWLCIHRYTRGLQCHSFPPKQPHTDTTLQRTTWPMKINHSTRIVHLRGV